MAYETVLEWGLPNLLELRVESVGKPNVSSTLLTTTLSGRSVNGCQALLVEALYL